MRARCPDIIINATTGGGPNMTMEERASSLEVGPEVASLNLAPDMSRYRLKERLPPLPIRARLWTSTSAYHSPTVRFTSSRR